MATTDFEDVSAVRETQSPDLLVAQADAVNPAAAPAGPAPATNTVEVADDLTLTLPAGASIEQPRVNGADLEFVQPDGSVIVVPNGALIGLTIVVGDATIPAETVAALFDANGIETAAGPEGNTANGASGSFRDTGPKFDGPGPMNTLLGDTNFNREAPSLEDLEDGLGFRRRTANRRPTIEIETREDDGGNGNATRVQVTRWSTRRD